VTILTISMCICICPLFCLLISYVLLAFYKPVLLQIIFSLKYKPRETRHCNANDWTEFQFFFFSEISYVFFGGRTTNCDTARATNLTVTETSNYMSNKFISQSTEAWRVSIRETVLFPLKSYSAFRLMFLNKYLPSASDAIYS
jgi:hypothetical protein